MLEEWTLHRPQVPPDVQGADVVLDWAVGKQGFPFQSFSKTTFKISSHSQGGAVPVFLQLWLPDREAIQNKLMPGLGWWSKIQQEK